jgi:hypothetical protein
MVALLVATAVGVLAGLIYGVRGVRRHSGDWLESRSEARASTAILTVAALGVIAWVGLFAWWVSTLPLD